MGIGVQGEAVGEVTQYNDQDFAQDEVETLGDPHEVADWRTS